MNDYEAIRRLIALYGQLLDSKRFDDWGRLFCEDATFRVWGRTHEGRSEIQREICGMQTETPGKHVVLQPVIDLFEEGLRAAVWTDLCALATGPQGIVIATIGRYHDRLRKGEDGNWQFEQRALVMGGEAIPGGVLATPSR